MDPSTSNESRTIKYILIYLYPGYSTGKPNQNILFQYCGRFVVSFWGFGATKKKGKKKVLKKKKQKKKIKRIKGGGRCHVEEEDK